MKSTQSLPGIMFLGYVPAERLQREIMYKYLAGVPVGIFTDVTPINFVGVPTCEAVSSYNNNGRIEQATLRFKTLDELPTNSHIAFVIPTAADNPTLLGSMRNRALSSKPRAPQERPAAILRYARWR
ncbi:MAG: hypothetical protein IIY87_00375 [Bacteroidales bacterium]|nr:hypothetical protein [Bacteroidales bacterium]